MNPRMHTLNVGRSIALCIVLAGAWSRWGWDIAFVVVGGISFVDATLARAQLLIIELVDLCVRAQKGWLPRPEKGEAVNGYSMASNSKDPDAQGEPDQGVFNAPGEARVSKTKAVALPAALAAITLAVAQLAGYQLDIEPEVLDRFFQGVMLLTGYFMRRAM